MQHPPRFPAPTHHPPAFITCVLFSGRALSPPCLRANDGGGFHPRNECLGVSLNFRRESKGGKNGLSCSDNNFDSCLLKRQGIQAGNPGRFPGNPLLHGRVFLATHSSYHDNTTTASSSHGSVLPNRIGFPFYFSPGLRPIPPPTLFQSAWGGAAETREAFASLSGARGG